MTNLTKLSAKDPSVATPTEIELLLCCARTSMDTTTAEQFKILLQEDIDWDYLFQMARQHKMRSLLYWHLNSICPEAAPQNFLEQLQKYFNDNAQRNEFLTKELLKLLNLLETHDILAIPFKGTVLAACAYGSLSLREFGDLDILVHEQDIQRAKQLLISQGYRPPAQDGWKYNIEHHFLRDDNQFPICVDLHQEITVWQFTSTLNLDYFQNRLETLLLLKEKTVYSFHTEDYLLILCIYLVRDFWQQTERLNQICDLAEILQSHEDVNWQRVVERATFLGCRRILFMGLFCCQNLLNISLSQDILQQMESDPVSKILALKICKDIFPQSLSSVKPRQVLLFPIHSRERLRDKIQYIVTPNYNDRKIMSNLPPLFSFFFYMKVRPIRLIYTHIIKPWLIWVIR